MGLAVDTASDDAVEVSVVIPCLNEVRTVGACVAAAIDGIEASGRCGEVIVADNGSTDGSIEAAIAAGARVVHAPRRGYGAALQAGFQAARGRLLVMGDADMSYDFREVPRLVERQRLTSADMVLGDRLGGRIERGAMPWTHRMIGNPLISFVIRRLFRVPLNDCYCGLRLLTRESYRRLRLNASSMEFALEMIVQGALMGMRFAQVPITLHVDGRDKPPHLRTVRDGYRSFRFLFQHAPITVYGLIGGVAILAGLALVGRGIWLEAHGAGGPATVAAGAVGDALVLTGWFLGILGTIARLFVSGFLGGEVDVPLRGLFRVAHLETAVLLSFALLVAGLALALVPTGSQAAMELGLTLTTAAIGTFVGAFVVSLIGRAIPENARAVSAAPAPVPAAVRVQPEDPAGIDPPAPGPVYQAWLAEGLRPAWEGARTLVEVSGHGWEVGAAITAAGGPVTGDQSQVGRESLPDAVVSAALLEHLEDDVAALRAMAARLRPGGRLGLVVAGGGARLFGPLDTLGGRVRRYTAPRLDARLRAAGFVVESIRPVDVVGALGWYLRGRVLRSGSHPELGVPHPLQRRADDLLRPRLGLWLVAIATLPASPVGLPPGP